MKNGIVANLSATAVGNHSRQVGARRVVSTVGAFIGNCVPSRLPALKRIHDRKALGRRREYIADLACEATMLTDEVHLKGCLERHLSGDLSCLASCLHPSLASPVFVDCSDDFADREVQALAELVRWLTAARDGEIDGRSIAAVEPHVKVLGNYLGRTMRGDSSSSN